MIGTVREVTRETLSHINQAVGKEKFSPRNILKLAIYSIAIFSLFIGGVCIFLTTIFYNPNELGASAQWLSISVASIALFVMSIVGLRGTYLVNLELLLTYFWGITVFISAFTLAVVACLDSYQSIDIYVRHSWENNLFETMRERFCQPNTANGKCLAPTLGNVTQWCVHNYNATDCQGIRDKAIGGAEAMLQKLTLSLGLVELATIILIFVSIYMCFKILTGPVITQSMNDIINYLLLLPMAASVGLSWYLFQYQTLLYFAALAYIFTALAVSQIVALPLGITAGRMKSQAMITMYVMLITLVTLGYLAAAAVGLIFAGEIVDETFQPTILQTESIACQKSLGCSRCNLPVMIHTNKNQTTLLRCPEWSQSEIITLMSLDLKIAAFVAIVSVIYLAGALTVGFIVWKNLLHYKSGFI